MRQNYRPQIPACFPCRSCQQLMGCSKCCYPSSCFLSTYFLLYLLPWCNIIIFYVKHPPLPTNTTSSFRGQDIDLGKSTLIYVWANLRYRSCVLINKGDTVSNWVTGRGLFYNDCNWHGDSRSGQTCGLRGQRVASRSQYVSISCRMAL